MENVIITISREFASGGRLVGKKLSELLGIPFYDKEIIELAAEKSGLSPEFIKNSEEQSRSAFIHGFASGAPQMSGGLYLQYETPANDKAFFAQSAVIRDLADKGSCVILGRCGGYILRERHNCVSVLLHSTLSDRSERAAKVYGMDYSDLADRLLKADKARYNYHKYYTGENWMDAHNYSLTLNTAICGVDGAVDAILAYIGKK